MKQLNTHACWLLIALLYCSSGCIREDQSLYTQKGADHESKNANDEQVRIVLVDSNQKLVDNKNQRVRLTGTYHSPGKGGRSLICKFKTLDISDYSFYKMDEKGHVVSPMIELVNHGDVIEVEADVIYFKGSKVPVANHPVIQWSPAPIELIDGVEYYVTPPSFSLANCKLLRIIED